MNGGINGSMGQGHWIIDFDIISTNLIVLPLLQSRGFQWMENPFYHGTAPGMVVKLTQSVLQPHRNIETIQILKSQDRKKSPVSVGFRWGDISDTAGFSSRGNAPSKPNRCEV